MAMTPRLKRLLRGFMTVGRLLFRVLGVVCVMIACGLIFALLYLYFSSILPLLIQVRTPSGVAMFLPASWISFNLLFNYLMVVITAPGTPTMTVSPEEAEALANEAVPAKGKGWSRWCKSCKMPKPPRSHHCHICNKCVLKMDHHCPWINQCVGHRNHRYFILFILYLWLSCLFGIVTIAMNHFGWLKSDLADADAIRSAKTTITFTFMISVAVWAVMILFLGWNLFLVLTNQTTIEFHFNRWQRAQRTSNGEVFCNVYDVGITRNLQQVFGPFHNVWQLLLPIAKALPNDGTTWLKVGDDVDDDDLW